MADGEREVNVLLLRRIWRGTGQHLGEDLDLLAEQGDIGKMSEAVERRAPVVEAHLAQAPGRSLVEQDESSAASSRRPIKGIRRPANRRLGMNLPSSPMLM